MTLGRDELRTMLEELQGQWAEFGGPQPLHQPASRRGGAFTRADLARITAVYGLTRHVHETARAIGVLLDNDLTNSAIPLVRLAYESALTAAWLVQSKDDHGISAFLHEYNRTRAALQKDALEAASMVFREGAKQVSDADPKAFEGSNDSVRRFHDICLDLAPGGKDAFVYYRLLSGYSHASVNVSDLYFEPPPVGEPMPAYRDPREALGKPILLFLTTSSMVWSARAFSYLSGDKQHRSRLRRSARALEIKADLHLSEHYHRRHLNRARVRASR